MRVRWALIGLATAACSGGGGGGSDCTMNLTVTNGGGWFSSGTLTSDAAGPNMCATVAAYSEPGKFLFFRQGEEKIDFICAHDDDAIGDKIVTTTASIASGPVTGQCEGTFRGSSGTEEGYFTAHGTLHIDRNDHVVGGRIAGSFSNVTVTFDFCTQGGCSAPPSPTFSGTFDVPITNSDRP